jgi:protein involved in polysaccharide export with SLBB domain
VSSSYVLKKLQNRLPKLVSEFAVLQNTNIGKILKIKNLTNPFEIRHGEELNFISSKNYRLAIKDYDDVTETNLLSELKSSDAVKVYYDGRLVLLLPPNYKPSELKLFEKYSKNSDLYKLYVGLNTTSSKNSTWNLLTYESEDFFSDSNNLTLGPSNVVNLFSNSFIRNEFINYKANINGVNFNINPISQNKIVNTQNDSNSQNNIVNTQNDLIPNANLIDEIVDKESSFSKQSDDLNTHIEIMKNSLRTISGSVQFPGAYPVAKKIRLSSFLSTAGLIEHTAKSVVNITEAVNQKDRLIRVNPKTIEINDTNFNKIVLSGIYYLDIPLAINDAITGVIELKGEVLVPGKYSFTRSEKLQDIIRRAGGLSDVAYPLGAELHRLSAKQLEKDSNNILADQLEASILNLAQSSLEGAGDQINVVLGYANQLRNQPTVGRMALNILDDNPSNPIFLEDGDKLTIPKRPSHVSVVGSVQRSTLATYLPGQNYNDYLQFAGGLTKVADIRKAYLLLPNGQSRQLNKNTVIPVGSTIIVPPKLDRLSILGGTDIISKVLNNISNSILSIKNVD